MKMNLNITILLLFFALYQTKAQDSIVYKIVKVEFKTIDKKTDDVLIGSLTEVLSDGKRIGIVNGDYDGISVIDICSRKIVDGKITLKVFGMKCLPFQKDFEVKKDTSLTVYLENGKTKYQNLEDRKLILHDLNIPICDIEVEKPKAVQFYKHCDGRIRKMTEIPKNELSEWEEIINN